MTWEPPATPPVPPYAAHAERSDPSADPGLWGLGAAAGVVALMIGLVLASGVAIAVAAAAGMEGDALSLLTVAALSVAYLAVIGVVWLGARRRGAPFAQALSFGTVPWQTVAGAAVATTVFGRGVAALWGALLTALGVEIPLSELDPTQLFAPGPWGVAATVLVAVVLAPIAEEIVFRGVLLPALRQRWGTGVAIAGSSAVFALMHITPVAILPIFLLALVLGYLFVRTRSLLVCIAAHALFNASGLLALYAAKSMGLL